MDARFTCFKCSKPVKGMLIGEKQDPLFPGRRRLRMTLFCHGEVDERWLSERELAEHERLEDGRVVRTKGERVQFAVGEELDRFRPFSFADTVRTAPHAEHPGLILGMEH